MRSSARGGFTRQRVSSLGGRSNRSRRSLLAIRRRRVVAIVARLAIVRSPRAQSLQVAGVMTIAMFHVAELGHGYGDASEEHHHHRHEASRHDGCSHRGVGDTEAFSFPAVNGQ